MITEEQCTDKTCLFCASDYHLEMILLPYIKERIDKNKIRIFTENSLEESINVVLNKVNLSENDKEKIRSLNWKNTEETGDIYLENDGKNIIVIVNGSFDYIKKVKSKINRTIGKNVELVECFHVGDSDVDISELSQKYENVLNTKKI